MPASSSSILPTPCACPEPLCLTALLHKACSAQKTDAGAGHGHPDTALHSHKSPQHHARVRQVLSTVVSFYTRVLHTYSVLISFTRSAHSFTRSGSSEHEGSPVQALTLLTSGSLLTMLPYLLWGLEGCPSSSPHDWIPFSHAVLPLAQKLLALALGLSH